ncbi:unnamed protein product [Bursaphelenchus okinawaensis]|uniref:Mediator complex subunit Med12 domain-containing protein n=1 Tax=Bursaphelenchus okinawaensis TaxID=465554 RepID=A0A811JVU0_9BILA|nr:unnamed protein product [Bursaphelenchus okinawaensis]CAG9086120.1 unnamed protein product [Bursaphelenchus okinawaensis]
MSSTNSPHVFSLHQVGEKRPFRKHKMPPDVYPQDPKQEEDSMSTERLRRGFMCQVPSCEWENYTTKNSRNMDDALARASKLIKNVIQQKDEHNKFQLDKKKQKDYTFLMLNNTNVPKEKTNWYDELAKGRSLAALAKKLPNIKKDGLEILFQSKVPIPRAIWCLKMNQIGLMIQQAQPNRGKKQLDQIKTVASFFKAQLKKLDSVQLSQLDCTQIYQRWPYYNMLFKNCFEEGVLDRQEFLFELCDLQTEYMNFALDRSHVFRLLINFTSNFIDYVTQNVFISRRLGYICAYRLEKYITEHEKKFGTISDYTEVINDFDACSAHRNIILILSGILRALIIDCPAAFVWNPTDVKSGSPEQLAGSPLDRFPRIEPFLVDNYFPPITRAKDILKRRLHEIRSRSQNVENKWARESGSQKGFCRIVNLCINVVAALDSFDVTTPNAYKNLYRSVFNEGFSGSLDSDHQTDMVFRVKSCLQWAITNEREGSHRALVVAKLFSLRESVCEVKNISSFAGFKLQDLLIDYINHEMPKTDHENFRKEYGNLIQVFFELQRMGLFDHDAYVRSLLRCGHLTTPIMVKIAELNPNSFSPTKSIDESERQDTSTPVKPDLSSGVISFIPPVDNSPMPVLQKPKCDSPWKNRQASDDSMDVDDKKEEMAWLLPEAALSSDEHIFLDNPPGLTVHERFLLQLPVEQLEENRESRNQRLSFIYGTSTEWDSAKAQLNQIAAEISKIWQKKNCFQFKAGSTEFGLKIRTKSDECAEFRQLTYNDQVVVVGKCVDSFMAAIYEFLDRKTIHIPTAEGLDVICMMMEECKYYAGIVELATELISTLKDIEEYIDSFESDYMPGFIASQMAYVICSYLAAHSDYFFCSKEAPEIVASLLETFDQAIRGQGYPQTGWSRAVIQFIWNTRTLLIDAKLATPDQLPARKQDFRRNFHEDLPRTSPETLKYNPELCMDMLEGVKRVFDYELYKLHLPSIEDDHSRYSFVCNVFKKALELKNDTEKLTELANFCSHVAAQKHMASTFYNCILEMCYPNQSKKMFLKEIGLNMDDIGNHYSMSTFILLLAARYCFSVHVLTHMLIYQVLVPIIQDDAQAPRIIASNVNGLCFTLRIVSGLVTASDRPFQLKFEEHRPIGQIRALRMLQINELDKVIFQLLSAVALLNENVKNDKNSRPQLAAMVKCSLLSMCEEEWVTKRMFWACETDLATDSDQKQKKDELFSCKKLKDNSVGQHLLRLALRRRAERKVKQELIVCKSNSRKSLLEKLFTTINLWNFHATLYDLRQLIKESNPNPQSKHAYQAAVHADVLSSEIARCCGELFGKVQNDRSLLEAPPLHEFKLADLNCYWLLGPLIKDCPQPENMPANFVNCSVKGKFLKDTATRLENSKRDENPKKLPNFLSQPPFVNLVLACLDGEEQQGDGLASALLKQLQELVNRVKEDTTVPHSHEFINEERTELLLRLNLISGMFETLKTSSVDQWSLVLFQLMYYGIISPDKDKDHFDATFDMLSMLIHSTLQSSQDGDRCRSPMYNTVVKKIKKELGERLIPTDLHCLQQLLPIPRRKLADNAAWDLFGYQLPQKTKAPEAKNSRVAVAEFAYSPQATRIDKFPQMAQKSLISLLQHTHFKDYKMPGIWGCKTDRQQNDLFLQIPEVERDPDEPAPPAMPQPMFAQPSGMPNSQFHQNPQMMHMGQSQPQMGPSSSMGGQMGPGSQIPGQGGPIGPSAGMGSNSGMGGQMGQAGTMGGQMGQAGSMGGQMGPTGAMGPGNPMGPNGGMGGQMGQAGTMAPGMGPGNQMGPSNSMPSQMGPNSSMPGQMGPSGPMPGPTNPMAGQMPPGGPMNPAGMGMPMNMPQNRMAMPMPNQPPPQGTPPPNRGGRGRKTTTPTQRGTKRKSKTNLMDLQDQPQHPTTANFPHAPPTHHAQQQMMQQGFSQQQQQQWHLQQQQMRMSQQRMQQQPPQHPQPQQPQMPPNVQQGAGMQNETKHQLQDAILRRQRNQQMQQNRP